MNIATCVINDCEAMTLPNQPYCGPHLAKAQEQQSISEPELEAKAQAARSEDDRHPGERKLYYDDGTSEWVPVEAVDPGPMRWEQAESPIRVTRPSPDPQRAEIPHPAPQYYPTESRSGNVGVLTEYLEGHHGMMAEMVARAMLTGMIAALRRL